MARGRALVEDVLPILERRVDARLDAYAAARLSKMCDSYADYIARARARASR